MARAVHKNVQAIDQAHRGPVHRVEVHGLPGGSGHDLEPVQPLQSAIAGRWPGLATARLAFPDMDGKQVFESARESGVNVKRIIITSSHPADRLHEEFDSSGCLAVIEKAEPEQQAAFLMILDSIMRR